VVSPQRESSVKSWFLRNIARPRPPQEFVPQIDGLRFVAIMAVLLYHIQGFVAVKAATVGQASSGLIQRILAEGSFGVPLFFAISGYILCRPFLGGRQVSLKRYFTRRLTRLEPPYLISLLLVFAAKLWALNLSFASLFPNLLASLFYSHNLIYGAHSEVNGVAWSLEIEWQFYLLAPLIFAIVSRSPATLRQPGLIALIILGGWAYTAGFDADPRLGLSLLRYIGFFMAGVWVAVLDEDHPEVGRDSVAFDLLGGAVWVAVIAALLGGREYAYYLPALTALIVLCGLRGYLFRKVLGWWPIYCIGAMCYTIYLYHFFVVSAVGRTFAALIGWPNSPGQALLIFSVIAVPLVLGACAIPYLLIERPFMVWRPGRNRLVDAFRSQA
jgi:peptidoglycan/LPS O-acetylase OafA/YrhL